MRKRTVAVGVSLLLVGGGGALYAISDNLSAIVKLPTALQATPSLDEQALLEQRAKAYWQARVRHDLDEAFTYEDPVRQKELGKEKYTTHVDAHLRLKKVNVLGVKMWPEGELADVKLSVEYEAPILSQMLTVNSEKMDDWQKFEGVWYHVLDLATVSNGRKPTIPGTTPKGAERG